MKLINTEVVTTDPKYLVDQIHQFVARYPKLKRSASAVGRCKMASYELALYLQQRGINARVTHLEGCKPGVYPNPHKIWRDKPSSQWSHYVVTVGRWTLDMTAKQFDTALGVPHMERLSSIREKWSTVEEDNIINNWVSETLNVRTR